jgi:DNA-binding IclR family transcriptional regulator
MHSDRATSVKTVDRLVEILDCFCEDRPAWSLAALSAHLSLPKSTLHRFLSSMEAHGMLRRDPDDKRWSLGYRLFIWGSVAAENTGLRHVAKPIMEDLVAATGETAILTVYHSREVICVEKVETSRSVRLTLAVGSRRPPHAGASSKVLMAHLPADEIQAIIRDNGLPKLCTNTITVADELLAELSRIRERGYAESREETDLGAWGVATPVVGADRNVVAGIGIAGPSSRFSDDRAEEYVRLCQDAARRLSTILRSGVDSGRAV